MALQPDLFKGNRSKNNNTKMKNQYVYLSYTVDAAPDAELDRRQTQVRYTYDTAATQLVKPKELILGMPASDDHNSGRLVDGPDDKLYYTIGDRGNNQDLNACRPNLAQSLPTRNEIANEDWTDYQGKTLRLNIDGSIPRDTPASTASAATSTPTAIAMPRAWSLETVACCTPPNRAPRAMTRSTCSRPAATMAGRRSQGSRTTAPTSLATGRPHRAAGTPSPMTHS